MSSMRPTERFTTRADDYARARPQYPDAVVDVLATRLALAGNATIADVGAGTGLSAEPFLRRGYAVRCVEPNAAMRQAAEERLAGYPGFHSTAGSAEHTGLPAHSVDCIVVAQAFHWFDSSAAKVEFARISRTGFVALMWNTRRVEGSAFLRGYEQLLREFGTDYAHVRERTERVSSARTLDDFFDESYERIVLENAQDLDLEGLRRRIASASYMPAEGTAAHGPLMAAATRLFERAARGGRVRIEYDLEIYLGRVLQSA